ncbi:hypothetical protein HW555_004325 [Spodoptera exigua]|uniref:Uncharacterized protein n=1 Tax=Spodoptera exigua TaxID=7107 RepID=A0A835GLA4_SPOEX|nr:hypothetical protein HW555_004325 [Spodoptera exigua]
MTGKVLSVLLISKVLVASLEMDPTTHQDLGIKTLETRPFGSQFLFINLNLFSSFRQENDVIAQLIVTINESKH